MGQTRQTFLKTAKTGAQKDQGTSVNQQALDKARVKAHLQTLTKERQIN